MLHAGPIIGLPFSWEGTAFFIEAIALGVFLYGKERLTERAHFASGIVVGLSGVASGILVVSANAWMNSPAGFRWVDGAALDVDPIAAMFNDAWLSQALHMTLAAFVSTAMAVAGVHALRLLQKPASAFHRAALRLALWFLAVSALLQPLSGDVSAKDVARRQPAKLAAMEALYHTQRAAPLLLGGIPDDGEQRVKYGLEIPYALSILAYGDPDAEVMGLERVPVSERPPTLVCHMAFQIMVGAGTWLALLALSFLLFRWKKPAWLERRAFLKLLACSTPLGFIAVEAGWVVTEVGRQPWIIYGIMKTRDAVTPMPGIVYTLFGSLFVYALLSALVALILARLIAQAEAGHGAQDEARHG
jgi:cytochrome d ubiquinol oxidase subunit I